MVFLKISYQNGIIIKLGKNRRTLMFYKRKQSPSLCLLCIRVHTSGINCYKIDKLEHHKDFVFSSHFPFVVSRCQDSWYFSQNTCQEDVDVDLKICLVNVACLMFNKAAWLTTSFFKVCVTVCHYLSSSFKWKGICFTWMVLWNTMFVMEQLLGSSSSSSCAPPTQIHANRSENSLAFQSDYS